MTHNAQHTIREQRNRFVENSTNVEEAIKKTEESLNIDLVCDRENQHGYPVSYAITVEEGQIRNIDIPSVMSEFRKRLQERGVPYKRTDQYTIRVHILV